MFMQFRVPQFIDIEDKVFGPFTLKQFGYIVGAGGLSFLIWTFIPIKFFAVLVIIPVAGLFLALSKRSANDLLLNFTKASAKKRPETGRISSVASIAYGINVQIIKAKPPAPTI